MTGVGILPRPTVPHHGCMLLGVSARSKCLMRSGFGTWPSLLQALWAEFLPRSCTERNGGSTLAGLVVAAWVQPPGQPVLSLCQPSQLSPPLWLSPTSLGGHRGPAHLSSQRQVCLEQSRAGPGGGPGLHTTLLP